jgi:CubicO group peptidase (beta-lactamase class C family)
MKTFLLTVSLFIASFVAPCVAQSDAEHLKNIDKFLQQEYPKNEPGAVVLIVKEGKILLKKAYGLASLKPKRKLKTQMVFPIASMSKQFVSAAVLQLVESGKISLNDPIQKYVPEYPIKKHPITIHHLLSQTSGIPEYFDVDENEYYLLAQEHTPQQLIAYYKDAPLEFEPGSKWSYSNSNYPLLGIAVEKVTGMSLKMYLEQFIFQPLQMTSSGLWYRKEIPQKRIPTGYDIQQGQLKKGPEMVGSALYAPGGIVSSVDDLYLWNRALRNQKGLSAFVVEQLTSEKKTNAQEGTNYGYGFFLRNLQGSETIEHGGNLFSFSSGGLYLPKEDIFICVLANTKFDRIQELSNYMASVLMNRPLKILSKGTISKELLQDYVGVYKLQSKTLKRTFEIRVYDNVLILTDPKAPQNDAKLTPSKKDWFLLKAAGASFQFVRNSEGEVVGYEVQQGSQTFQFQKVKR